MLSKDLAGKIEFDHCVIASSDLGRTDAFYRAVFGAVVNEPSSLFQQYRIGSHMINVHGPGLPQQVSAELTAKIPVAPGNSDLCFAWNGTCDDLVDHLATCGVAVTVGPERRNGARGAGISYYFRDPGGSLLEFIVYCGTKNVLDGAANSE